MNVEKFVNDFLEEHTHDVLLSPYNALIEFAKQFKEKLNKEAMETSNKLKIFIINPDTIRPVTIDEWRKDDIPSRAQLLAIETEDGRLIIMRKSYLPGEYTFEDAQKACALFKPIENVTFRCPTRKECIDLYDARFQGLDEAIELTGGDYAKRSRDQWTVDLDTDPNYAGYAWCCSDGIGYLDSLKMCTLFLALPVAIVNSYTFNS